MIRLLVTGIAVVLAAAAGSVSASPPDMCLRLQSDQKPIVCIPVGGGGSG